MENIDSHTTHSVPKSMVQCYKVSCSDRLYAGEYPGAINEDEARVRIQQLYDMGIRHFVDLTEEEELRPYASYLPKGVTHRRFAICDCSAPPRIEDMHRIVEYLEDAQNLGGDVYVHCWGGIGRTGTVVACYIAKNMHLTSYETALEHLIKDYTVMPKATYRDSPETFGQLEFIKRFVASISQSASNDR